MNFESKYRMTLIQESFFENVIRMMSSKIADILQMTFSNEFLKWLFVQALDCEKACYTFF